MGDSVVRRQLIAHRQHRKPPDELRRKSHRSAASTLHLGVGSKTVGIENLDVRALDQN